ncbi:MAG: DUF2914 domain-containing protein [bacterium]|nr:DUF2914 domain-containing protein [bacterium]
MKEQIGVFVQNHERILLPAMLIFGLVVDFVTFRSIQIQTAFLLLGIHVVVAGVAIIVLHRYKTAKRALFVAPLVVQFTFGALLSAAFIFYWFSGSLSVSWPLICLIAVLMTSNDVFRKHYLRPSVQISVYYFAVFSYFSVVFPFVLNSLEVWVFLFAGVSSLLFIFTYMGILSSLTLLVPVHTYRVFAVIMTMFIVMNGLYFSNTIPPIPLSIREAGAYHQVEHVNESYLVLSEKESFIDRMLPGQTIHLRAGDPLYVFSSVFAPGKLNTRIVHNWQYYDEDARKWIDKNRFAFSIIGGRKEGYRGYSLKSAVQPGKWRVRVETERGQVLGRIKFDIEFVGEMVDVVELMK